jgi:hypothetical protein
MFVVLHNVLLNSVMSSYVKEKTHENNRYTKQINILMADTA